MIKSAIFDLDGTILDSSAMWLNLGARYVSLLGKTPEEDLSDRLSEMSMLEGARYLHKTYNIPYSSEEILRHLTRMTEEYYQEQAAFKQGATKLLSALHSRCIRMSIATAGDSALAMSTLSKLGVADFFAGAVSCNEFGAKTSPEVFLAAADLIYAIPEETIVFEDSLRAVQTAKKAGFFTAAVKDISEKNQEDLKRCADVYAESLEEFSKRITELLAMNKNSQ